MSAGLSQTSCLPSRQGRILAWLLPACVAALCALPVTGCGWLGRGGGEVIAEIGGDPISQEEFDEYVERTLTDGAEAGEEAPSGELLSRLLDRFLDEELVVREARRRGMRVSPEELSDELSWLSEGEAEAARAPGADNAVVRSARRAVLLRKFREGHVLAGISVSEEEIAGYYDRHRRQFQRSSRLVLRQILLDDESRARGLSEELSNDPTKFVETAGRESLAPDAGMPAAYETANLPPEILEAVDAVEEGQVSGVSKSPEGFRIFLVEKREAAREVTIEEAAERIRVILMQEKSRTAYEELLASLRVEAGVVIHEKNLGFQYSK